MAEVSFLDTNAYWLLLLGRSPAASDACQLLRARLSQQTWVEGVISELTALEIHSVIGKLSRGKSGGIHRCDRKIDQEGNASSCPFHWVQPKEKGLRKAEIERVRKAIRDAEKGVGPIRMTVVPLSATDFDLGREYLYRHAEEYTFGSHDAVIAAAAKRYIGGAVRLITSDRGLKSLLRSIAQPYYDPLSKDEWDPPVL